MKKLLIILLFGFFPFLGKSQINQITLDSASGGQLQAELYATGIFIANDSVKVESVWGFNSSFAPAFASAIGVFVNTDSIPDTVAVASTIDFTGPGPGTYYFKVCVISFITGDTVCSVSIPQTVTPIWTAPTISFSQPGVPMIGGGLQAYNYDCGNTTADFEVWLSPGDTSFSFPFMIYTIQLTGSGQNNFTFTGYPPQSQYELSYKFVLKNSVGSDTTDKHVMTTLSDTSAQWISNLDSSVVDVNSVVTYYNLMTNNTNCLVKAFVALASNPSAPIDSVVQSFAGQGGIDVVASPFVGLSSNTAYVFWACAYSALDTVCSTNSTLTTLTAPYPLTVTITGTYTVPNTATQRFNITDTSEASGTMWLEIANMSDPNFTLPIYADSTIQFGVGVNNFTRDIAYSGFVPGTTYLAKVKGFNSIPEFDESPVIQFTFMPIFTGISELPEFSNVFVSNNELVVGDSYTGNLVMIDMSGRVVGNFQKIDVGEARFPLYSFKPGIYILHSVGIKPFKFPVQSF